jgi:hypothetical protein
LTALGGAPQRDRQALGAHRLIGVQREHREHGARPGAAELHRTAVGADLERTEDPELQHCAATLPPARRPGEIACRDRYQLRSAAPSATGAGSSRTTGRQNA